MSRIFLGLYSVIWRAATPFLRRHKRLADGFEQRLVPLGWPFLEREREADDRKRRKANYGTPMVWVQAASGGEAWLVHELVAGLSKTRPEGMPEVVLLCTSCTSQGIEILNKLPKVPGFDIATAFFPLDRPAIMRRAIEQVQPSLIVLLETELWPGLASEAGRYGIPMIVLNGRITLKSLSGYKWFFGFWKRHSPDKILAMSLDDAGRFAELFSPKIVEVMPNIKFDGVARQCAAVTDSAGLRMIAGFSESEILFVLASVRQEEEELLMPEIRKMLSFAISIGNVVVVVAPRHMHRVEIWMSLLEREGISAVLFSSGLGKENRDAPESNCTRVVVWDVFGRLSELYAMADSVFVGGSLAPLGGQNFLEPLAQGVRPCIGGFWENFRWVGNDIFNAGLVEMLPGPDELAATMKRMAIDFSICSENEAGATKQTEILRLRRRLAVSLEFSQWLDSRLGGSLKAAQCVWEFVQKYVS